MSSVQACTLAFLRVAFHEKPYQYILKCTKYFTSIQTYSGTISLRLLKQIKQEIRKVKYL